MNPKRVSVFKVRGKDKVVSKNRVNVHSHKQALLLRYNSCILHENKLPFYELL